MVELRKRKAPAEAPAPSSKKASSVKGAASKTKEAVVGRSETTANGFAASAVSVGSTITLDGFGGEVETHDGAKTTLKQLVDESKGGVVLFTYPKASTPGCTTQACLFRDEYSPLTATGYSIFGLSRDSPKSNTTFKTKQNLPYVLLCDPSATLIGAIGMKKATGTTRGIFVIDKSGKVLAVEPGGPAATADVVRKLVAGSKSTEKTDVAEDVGNVAEGSNVEVMEAPAPPLDTSTEPTSVSSADEQKKDLVQASVADEVADTAEKLDAVPAAAAPMTA